jgi:hypothetical protein
VRTDGDPSAPNSDLLGAQGELSSASMLPMVTKLKNRDMLESVQVLHFFSQSRMTAAVTTLIARGDAADKSSPAQLKDELVFKGERDVMARTHGSKAHQG